MDLNHSKIELAKRILARHDPEIIKQIQSILDAEMEKPVPPLRSAQKEEIELGLAQLDQAGQSRLIVLFS